MQICYARYMARLFYFAQLVDALGITSEDIRLDVEPISIAELSARLAKRGGVWQRVFSQPQSLRIAINKSFANLDSTVSERDEVAFVASGPVL